MDEVTFEHVVTVYQTPNFEDGVALQQCSRCGALVMPAARQRHTAWHDKTDAPQTAAHIWHSWGSGTQSDQQ